MKKESENKINTESLKAFEEFQKTKKESNLKMYKIIIILVLIFNIVSIIFYIIFKYHIYSIRNSNSFLNENIIEKENELNFVINKNEKMMVNLISFNYKFCYIFKKYSEIDLIRNSIFEQNPGKYKSIDDIRVLFVYQSLVNGDKKQKFINQILDFENIAIIIETTNKKRFGFYLSKPINFNKNETKCIIKDENAFLFSLNNQQIFKIKDKEKPAITITIEGEIMFEIGDGDVIVKNNFYQDNGVECESNFPKNFEGNFGDLIGNKDKFYISILEVFHFY